MNEEVEFIDAEHQFQTAQGASFKDIIMQHLSKISTICTKQFREGYWQKKPVKVGDAMMTTEIYHEDTREAYINSVDFLHDMLLPHLIKHATYKEEIDKAIKDLESKKDGAKDNNDWIYERLQTRRKIFQQLSLLLDKKKYFGSESIMD